MYADNEMLFPSNVIPQLRKARGEEWKALVDRVARLPEDDPESLAFSLLMIRIDGCLDCETDSYRAMRGCNLCALQMLRRFKGSDGELLEMYQEALVDVRAHLESQPQEILQEPVLAARAA